MYERRQLIANELRTLAIRVYGHPLEGEKYRSMVEQLFSNSNVRTRAYVCSRAGGFQLMMGAIRWFLSLQESKVLDFVAFNKTTEVVKDVLKFYRDKAKNKYARERASTTGRGFRSGSCH